jgi:pimeloyl-ACP methyl ester carboxylesterase
MTKAACGALLLAVLLAGCGGSARPPHQAARRVDGCVQLGTGVRAVTLRPPGASRVAAVLLGKSPTTFVLSNESDEDLCSWLPLVRTLRAHGYAALLYDYEDPAELPADAKAGAATARAAGARKVVLMGASVGARASIEAAAKAPPGVESVIAVSAERTVRSDPRDLIGPARHDRLPTLLISAREDPYLVGDTAQLARALAAGRKRTLIVPGIDHGTALLTGASRDRVDAAILAFARSFNRSG